MTGRHPRAMRPRDETAHPVIKDAVAKGHVGSGIPYVIPGFTTWEAADRGRRSVNNAARHLGYSCSSRAADHILEAPDGTYEVHFRLYAKNEGRQHIVSKAGGDPARMAYNPFKRGEGPIADDDGRLLR